MLEAFQSTGGVEKGLTSLEDEKYQRFEARISSVFKNVGSCLISVMYFYRKLCAACYFLLEKFRKKVMQLERNWIFFFSEDFFFSANLYDCGSWLPVGVDGVNSFR